VFEMKLLALAVLVPATALASFVVDNDLSEFLRFESRFNKVYSSEDERSQKFEVFKQNLAANRQHNNRPNASYRRGINQFSDLTAEEFKSIHLGKYIKTGMPSSIASSVQANLGSTELPKSVDWRSKGIISPVKNQGGCGSCWAHTVIEQLESYLALATGNMTILSVQELVSCMPNVLECGGTGGCFGATCEMAYQWIQNFGMVTEETMPYTSGTSGETGTCGLDVANMERVGWLRGYETLMRNDQAAVMEHLATKGPLGIALDASVFHQYQGGIFEQCDYDKNIEINHGVQLVGYGENPEEGKFWIVRNSWGEMFGEGGYIRLRRDDTAKCGIDNTPAIGLKCKGDGFAEDYVCGMCGLLFAPSYPIGAMTSAHISPP